MSGSGPAGTDSSTCVTKAPVIETPRVRLVPLGLADAAAIVHGHRPPGARWADGYPTDATLVVAGLVVTAEGDGAGGLGPYRGYQVVRRDDGMVIGDCGFLGPPDARGEVHVGFGVAEVAGGYRLAGEALQGLIAWAHRQEQVERVVAEAAPTNIASLRVLEQAGMRRVGEESGIVVFEG